MDPEIRISREEMLRRAVLSGDENAWRTLYGESFSELYRFAVWRCGGHTDAADEMVQETWLTAVRQIRSFHPQQGNFLAWLRGIAANVRRNQLRSDQRTAKSLRSIGVLKTSAIEQISNVEDRDVADEIARALDALPQRQESVLIAKYIDGLTVGQIASAWNETPKAIESLLSRARQAFREHFEKE